MSPAPSLAGGEPASSGGKVLRILTVVDGNFPGTTGGAELQAGFLSRSLAARGHHVDVVAPQLNPAAPEHETIWGLRVWRIPYPHVRGVGAAILQLRFGDWLLRNRRRYDAIHVHMVKNMAAVAGLLRPALDATVVVKVSGAWEFDGGVLDPKARERPLYRFMNRCIQQVDYVQCISGYTARVVREAGYREKSIAMIPNAIDTKAFGSGAEAATVPPPTVLFVGRVERVKGLDVLLRAWVDVVARIPEARLIIGGDGSQRNELIELAATLGVAASVEFPGHIKDVPAFLRLGRVYVQPSYREGLSNSLMQAMAMSLAVVATRISGSEDLVTDGVNGRLVEPGDSEALARAIADSLADERNSLEMGRRARTVVVDQYDVDAVLAKLVRAYRREL